MSGGFLVEVAGLGELIKTLSEAADRMRVANSRLKAASAADLGSDELDRAAAAFQARWEYGIGKISDASGQMADSLRETKKLYEEVDQAVAELFPDPGGGSRAADDNSGPVLSGVRSPISQALDGSGSG